MESGKRSYQIRRAKLAPIVDAALHAFEPQQLNAPVELTREVEPDLPDVWADPQAMTEAILNLLNNAHKYTGIEKKIAVSVKRSGPTVQIRVADNGPGIAARDQKRIFDKFYRARDPLSRTIEGTGLGLAMVKHIVAGHDGQVSVQSEVGKGATFTIVLPAVED
jgi:two-component system phosphate regulon sensor histidine kinase PhoR